MNLSHRNHSLNSYNIKDHFFGVIKNDPIQGCDFLSYNVICDITLGHSLQYYPPLSMKLWDLFLSLKEENTSIQT